MVVPVLDLLFHVVLDGVNSHQNVQIIKHGVVALVPTILKVFLSATVDVDHQIKFVPLRLDVLPTNVVATKTNVPVNQVALLPIQ